jgi:molybdopterin adenylyltransferase
MDNSNGLITMEVDEKNSGAQARAVAVQAVGRIVAISISQKKGQKKNNVAHAVLKENFGIVGDVHAGTGLRQVSFLSMESLEAIQGKGIVIRPGDFAENITVRGIDLTHCKIGEQLKIGDESILEITQIGKSCHSGCEILKKLGDCIMPREGIFARVIKGGAISVEDAVAVCAVPVTLEQQ